MADLIEQLCNFDWSDELGNGDFSLLQKAADEIERLRRALTQSIESVRTLNDEARESDDLRIRLTGILTATANALKGDPGPMRLHSWHDLAEVAANLLARIDGSPVGQSLGMVVYYDDGQEHEAAKLEGKRVALVVIE